MICAFLVKSLKMKIVKKLFQPNLFSGLSAPTNQLFRRSCLDKIKWHDFFSLMWLTDLLTNRHWKFLSDAQLLENLGKIPCKFKLNPSSCLGGVVVTRFFDFDDLLTDWHQQFLSDAKLNTLWKIPWRFQLNPSSCLGGVVVTRFLY